MSVDNYLEMLQDIQREYRRIHNRIEISTAADPYTSELAELHSEASECCRKITSLLGNREDSYELRKWEKRRAEHLDACKRILEHIKSKKNENIAAASKSSEDDNTVDDETKKGWFCETPKQSFDDVAGMEYMKEELRKHVKNADKKGLFELFGMDAMTGFLFYGPPGCGKTYLIEAFVHELMKDGYKYMSIESGDILSKYQGESEKRVKEIFRTAEDCAPCILFLDEIDNLCTDRNTPDLPPHKVSLTEAFLTAFNHMKSSGKEVFFMAATNFPQKIDIAMSSRMKLERVPLPDQAAITHYLEFKFNKASIQIDDSISWEKMAKDFKNCSYRDIDALINNVKRELITISDEQGLNDEESVEAVVSGKIRLNAEIYKKSLSKVIFAPINSYMKELEAWEAKMNINRTQDGDEGENKGGKDDKGNQENSDTPRKHTRKSLFGDKSKSVLKEGNTHFQSIPQDGNMFNSNPFMDIQKAFIFNECICPATVAHQESGERYLEYLEKLKEALQAAGDSETVEALNNEIIGVRNALYYPADELHTRFSGMADTAFDISYDPFFTLLQGNSVQGFYGTCGIIASCNMVNQQTGSRLTEADGVAEFTAAGICTEEGGTSTENRECFIRSKNLQFEAVEQDWMEDIPGLPGQELEEVARRFREGESVMLGVMAEDLSQDELFSREVDPEFQMEVLLRMLEDPESVPVEDQIAAFYPGLRNHMVSVAGFSYAQDGSVTGFWINDTGGWASLITNRIFLSAEKYNLMKEATRGFSVEFVKK